MNKALKKNFLLALSTGAWLCAVFFGIWKLNQYSNTPGEAAAAKSMFPLFSKLQTYNGKPSLVMFLHPKCGCSRATLGEMARLMPKLKDRASVNIVFLKPKGFSESDVRGDLWIEANSIPHAIVSVDSTNNESNIFGANTSGQAFLYDASGHLVFEGGITPSRGHMGDAPGQEFIVSYFENHTFAIPTKASVFGCSLHSANPLVASGNTQ